MKRGRPKKIKITAIETDNTAIKTAKLLLICQAFEHRSYLMEHVYHMGSGLTLKEIYERLK